MKLLELPQNEWVGKCVKYGTYPDHMFGFVCRVIEDFYSFNYVEIAWNDGYTRRYRFADEFASADYLYVVEEI